MGCYCNHTGISTDHYNLFDLRKISSLTIHGTYIYADMRSTFSYSTHVPIKEVKQMLVFRLTTRSKSVANEQFMYTRLFAQRFVAEKDSIFDYASQSSLFHSNCRLNINNW